MSERVACEVTLLTAALIILRYPIGIARMYFSMNLPHRDKHLVRVINQMRTFISSEKEASSLNQGHEATGN